jgi:hypothetical protein
MSNPEELALTTTRGREHEDRVVQHHPKIVAVPASEMRVG